MDNKFKRLTEVAGVLTGRDQCVHDAAHSSASSRLMIARPKPRPPERVGALARGILNLSQTASRVSQP